VSAEQLIFPAMCLVAAIGVIVFIVLLEEAD
jgi:hypothetical protein